MKQVPLVRRRLSKTSLALLAGLAVGHAPAAIVVTVDENRDGIGTTAVNPGVPLAVSSTDLVNAGQPSLGSVSWEGFTAFTSGTTSSPAVLNDGADGGWNLTAGNTAVTTQAIPWSLTYTLDLSEAALGYDITGVDVMSLWTNDFVNQHYSVEISTLTVPVFTPLTGPVVALTATSGGSAGSSIRSSIREDGSGILASGVTGIRFVFEAQANPFGAQRIAAYREVDVFGHATIPEPSTAGLGLVAAGLTIMRRLRPRRA